MARSNSKLVEAVDKLILDALKKHHWSISKTAKELACSVRTVSNHARKFRAQGVAIPKYVYQRFERHEPKCMCTKCKRSRLLEHSRTLAKMGVDLDEHVEQGTYCKKCGRVKMDKLLYADGACAKCSGLPIAKDCCSVCGKRAKVILEINQVSYCVGCRLDKHAQPTRKTQTSR